MIEHYGREFLLFIEILAKILTVQHKFNTDLIIVDRVIGGSTAVGHEINMAGDK